MIPVRIETDSGAAVITLNDSAHGNTLTPDCVRSLAEYFAAAISDNSVRVILLRSNGATFCRGMDFSTVPEVFNNANAPEEAIARFASLLKTITASPKPVLCLARGEVIAGGVGLAGACDIVVATPGASFQLSEVFFGLIPANVMPFLCPSRLSPHDVRYLALTGKKMPATEAMQRGLVDEVFPETAVEKGVKAIIKNLFRASPSALAFVKHFTHENYASQIDSMMENARRTLLELLKTPDVIDAINAFRDGGVPAWFARYTPQRSFTEGCTL